MQAHALKLCGSIEARHDFENRYTGARNFRRARANTRDFAIALDSGVGQGRSERCIFDLHTAPDQAPEQSGILFVQAVTAILPKGVDPCDDHVAKVSMP